MYTNITIFIRSVNLLNVNLSQRIESVLIIPVNISFLSDKVG